jgi:hypothetical protein
MKNCIVSFFHTNSITHQQNTINNEDNIIRKQYKYVLNNTKTVTRGVSTEWLLRNRILWAVAPCRLVIYSRRFEETYRHLSQGCESIHGLITTRAFNIVVISSGSSGNLLASPPALHFNEQCGERSTLPPLNPLSNSVSLSVTHT